MPPIVRLAEREFRLAASDYRCTPPPLVDKRARCSPAYATQTPRQAVASPKTSPTSHHDLAGIYFVKQGYAHTVVFALIRSTGPSAGPTGAAADQLSDAVLTAHTAQHQRALRFDEHIKQLFACLSAGNTCNYADLWVADSLLARTKRVGNDILWTAVQVGMLGARGEPADVRVVQVATRLVNNALLLSTNVPRERLELVADFADELQKSAKSKEVAVEWFWLLAALARAPTTDRALRRQIVERFIDPRPSAEGGSRAAGAGTDAGASPFADVGRILAASHELSWREAAAPARSVFAICSMVGPEMKFEHRLECGTTIHHVLGAKQLVSPRDEWLLSGHAARALVQVRHKRTRGCRFQSCSRTKFRTSRGVQMLSNLLTLRMEQQLS